MRLVKRAVFLLSVGFIVLTNLGWTPERVLIPDDVIAKQGGYEKVVKERISEFQKAGWQARSFRKFDEYDDCKYFIRQIQKKAKQEGITAIIDESLWNRTYSLLIKTQPENYLRCVIIYNNSVMLSTYPEGR